MSPDPPPSSIAPGVLRLRVPVPFALEHVNVYLVDTGAGFMLVDTGVRTRTARLALDEGLTALGLGWHDVAGVVLTHFHPDHSGLAAYARERSGAPVVMSAVDAMGLRLMLASSGVPPAWEGVGHHGVPEQTAAAFHALFAESWRLIEPFTPDGVLAAGERLPGGRPIEAVLTPGHSPGHLCLAVPDAGLLLSGDHVLPAITPHIGLYSPADPDPLHSYLASLRAVLGRAPARMLPGHGEPIEDPAARVRELLAHHDRRLDHTLAAARPEGVTAWTIAHTVFGALAGPFDAFLAVFETLAHLTYLEREGLVASTRTDGRVLYRPAVAGAAAEPRSSGAKGSCACARARAPGEVIT